MKFYHVFLLLLQILITSSNKETIHVIWHAPFYSGGGYCSESTTILKSFIAANISISIIHHGDSYNEQYVSGLPQGDMNLLLNYDHNRIQLPPNAYLVSICHSEPGAWYTPVPNYRTSPCPTTNSDWKIGRTMFETDSIPSGWTNRLAYMDEIWVPTMSSRDIFEAAGVKSTNLYVLGEPVDTDYFSSINADNTRPEFVIDLQHKVDGKFVFLFVGKWETRKGIDILVRAFHHEFHTSSDAILFILTNAYHSTNDFKAEILGILYEHDPTTIHQADNIMLLSDIAQVDMPAIYHLADILVMPSYGEGWGRPHMEAMSMGVPVVATNWSGPTAYMTNDNSFLLEYDLVPSMVWKGHNWAKPRESYLQQLIRYAFEHREEVVQRGKKARDDMVNHYSIIKYAEILQQKISLLLNKLQHQSKHGSLHDL